ncbi:carboxypeptidase-like regulatory domain-containing protein [Aequorivita sp. F47161]|uniref:Carboxypeptidase-like regulatory domain-containing protein n=1 Tax=Aequorivita vitellina TaxID=2874475 RepID=A0A9X1U429_9FLAO|nr:carboxypeptidase-like regulatory domain-containing protein [Aequorivita vitellina]MCG2419837.1 carboxypeptidase-like regulatory domain-containing protein [Aequorivita vitellina]MCZ4318677.1 carboxypeptidase-like regulatory domain-containing protein [Aequorivita viscosa]
MKKYFLLITLVFFVAISTAQENHTIKGTVMNDADDAILENVNIVNLNQVKGTTTNEKGEFAIKAAVNDTLYFSYLGFKSLRVRVTNDWLKFGDIKVKMTELGIALEEVVVKPVQLTGYVEIDAKLIPIYDNYRYRISGLSSGYEGGSNQPGAVSKVLSSIFNPADFLYNVFGKRPRQMKKLRKMKEDDEIRNLLQSKFDRETLMAVLQLERPDIDEILNKCNYSKNFIRTANDLQILDAISVCYEEYKILNREK